MNFRLAAMEDLPQLKQVYQDIIRNMDNHQICIWDDIYPCEFLEEDIKNNQLYVLLSDCEIISAFVLGKTNSGESAVKWDDNHAEALYIDRLGVNIKYLKKGMNILEIGAGTGAYSLMFAKKGYQVDSLELVQHNLDILKSKITSDMNINTVQGNALDMSMYNDDTLDVVLCLGPLYHLENENRKNV